MPQPLLLAPKWRRHSNRLVRIGSALSRSVSSSCQALSSYQELSCRVAVELLSSNCRVSCRVVEARTQSLIPIPVTLTANILIVIRFTVLCNHDPCVYPSCTGYNPHTAARRAVSQHDHISQDTTKRFEEIKANRTRTCRLQRLGPSGQQTSSTPPGGGARPILDPQTLTHRGQSVTEA